MSPVHAHRRTPIGTAGHTDWVATRVHWKCVAACAQPGIFKAPTIKFDPVSRSKPKRGMNANDEPVGCTPGPGQYYPRSPVDRRKHDKQTYSFGRRLPSMFNPSSHVDPLQTHPRKTMLTSTTVPWNRPSEWPIRAVPKMYTHVGPTMNICGDPILENKIPSKSYQQVRLVASVRWCKDIVCNSNQRNVQSFGRCQAYVYVRWHIVIPK